MSVRPVEHLGSLSRQALDHFVYIIGVPRGGTSILRDAIGLNDHVLLLPGMTHFMNQVWRYRKKVHQRLLRQIFRLPGFYQEEKVLQSLDEERRRELRVYIDRAINSRDLKRMWEIYPLVYGLDEENQKRCDRIRCWIDKANDFHGVRRVAHAFPKGKFILIVRDPRGAVSSLAKRMAVKETHRTDAVLDDEKLIESCISWRRMTQQMVRFHNKHRKRSLLVKFEDFLGSPVAVLNSIFQFIVDKPLADEILSRRLSELVYGTTNLPGEGGVGIRSEPAERWRKLLDDRQVGLIGELTEKTSEKTGYRQDKPRFRVGIRGILRQIPGLRNKSVIFLKMAYLHLWEFLI